MKMIEISAKTMEDAVTQGLEKLGVSFSDVVIDILDEGSKGFLGLFGAKPVTVRLTVRQEESNILGDVGLGKQSKPPKSVRRETSATQAPRTKMAKPQPKTVAPKAKPARTSNRPAQKSSQPKVSNTVPATQETADAACAFLQELTNKMGVTVQVTAKIDEEGNLRVSMDGDTSGVLIGRRGETLDALQYLTSLVVNRHLDSYVRITLDTENYRARREEALTRLANRMASRAIKTGRKVVMEPMNPYERRILHSALQKNEGVTTHSEGEEPNRHVVIVSR